MIKEVLQQSKDWPIILSWEHPFLIENLLKNNISEIKDGNIEIVKITCIVEFKFKVILKAIKHGID